MLLIFIYLFDIYLTTLSVAQKDIIGGWTKLHAEELHNWHSSSNTRGLFGR